MTRTKEAKFMQAVVYDGSLRVVSDYRPPDLHPGEARIRVALAGICSTDIAITQGYKGWHGVLGHEFVGVVDAVGSPDDAAWVGRRVVGEINLGCGDCDRCRAGLQNHCDRRSALGIFGRDGAFATWCSLPVRNLHPVPDGVSDEEAVFTEPLAAALEVLEQLHVRPDSRAAVVGDGKLGLLVAQVLALSGTDVALVGRHPERLGLVASQGVRGARDGERFPLVVDCTGSPDGFRTARSLLEPRGRLVLKSTHLSPPEIDWSRLMVDEVTVMGSRCGPFAPALRLLAAGKVRVAPLIAATFPLEQAVEAFAAARGRLKVLLRPS
jgi:alcohol dehydrogenase